MPLDKFVLIMICVIVAAGLTVWIGAMAAAALQMPAFAWMFVLPAVLVGFVVWRVIAERWKNAEDDHYDKIEK